MSEAQWSPDSKEIAFASRRSGVHQVYIMNADGTHLSRLTSLESPEHGVSWSPDGTRLALTIDTGSSGLPHAEILIMHRDSTALLHIPTGSSGISTPKWSPDGSKLLCVEAGFGFGILKVFDAYNGQPVQQYTASMEDTRSAVWAPFASPFPN